MQIVTAFHRFASTTWDALTAEERQIAPKLPPVQRRDWIAGRAARRAVLARMREAGAGDRSPRVSVTHRDGRALAAAVLRGWVGVDLERRVALPGGWLRYFATAAEQRWCAAQPAVALWALKEAAWKALGLAGGTAFRALELTWRPDGRLTALTLGGRRLPAAGTVRTTARWTVAWVWVPRRHP